MLETILKTSENSKYLEILKTSKNSKKIAQEHFLKPKTDLDCKLIIGLIVSTNTQLNSLFALFRIQQ